MHIYSLAYLLSAPDPGLGSESDPKRRAHFKAALGVRPEVVVQLPASARASGKGEEMTAPRKSCEGNNETVNYDSQRTATEGHTSLWRDAQHLYYMFLQNMHCFCCLHPVLWRPRIFLVLSAAGNHRG